jgi:tricorn protease
LRNPRIGADQGASKKKAKTGGSALAMFDMHAEKKEREEKTIVGGLRSYELAAKVEKLLVATTDNEYAVLPPKPDQKIEDKIDFSNLEATIDPRHEWDQILGDAYRIVRDFFYEPTLHGNDWRAIYERFHAALADATSRDDLHYVLSEMISELNIGHAYNSGGPGIPEAAPKGRAAGLLGCDWKLDQGAYRISKILGGSSSETDARSPLAQPGVDAHEGDWLLAVNGVKVDASADVYAAFVGLGEKQPAELTLNAAPALDGHERRVVVTTIPDESGLRYRAWVEHNRALVDELSKGRIAYVHVPDTGARGQNELVRQFVSQYQKDALLVDERWNSGGQIPTRFIELLNRPITNFWALRHGDDWVWPQVGQRGPKAMLINGSSGSGGDAFPYYFRQAKLGPLIGMRTWGGLVGISGNPEFIDGSAITVPRFAFYEKDGTWGVEGYGVAPDIEVIDDPALMVHGEDPQLAEGVKNLLKQLESWPFDKPARPASPDRRGAGVLPSDR